MKVENSRMDVLSRKRFPKEELIRLVLVEGKLTIDKEGKLPGRGVYLKKGNGKEALKKKAFLSLTHRPLSKEEEELLITL